MIFSLFLFEEQSDFLFISQSMEQVLIGHNSCEIAWKTTDIDIFFGGETIEVISVSFNN